jgi:hypothetical protein
MNSTSSRKSTNSEKLQDDQFEDARFTNNNAGYGDPVQLHQHRIEQEKAASRPTGIWGTFSKLGDLPEWNVPGKSGRLRGKALNTSISWVSCLAFLMFGYD